MSQRLGAAVGRTFRTATCERAPTAQGDADRGGAYGGTSGHRSPPIAGRGATAAPGSTSIPAFGRPATISREHPFRHNDFFVTPIGGQGLCSFSSAYTDRDGLYARSQAAYP